eukprot:2885464-Lingulodinium_polyedra.AAC.1
MEGLAARLEEIREPEARQSERLEATVDRLLAEKNGDIEVAVLELREASRGGLRELREAMAVERRLRASEAQRLAARLQELGEAQRER